MNYYEKKGQKPILLQDSCPPVTPLKDRLRKAVDSENYELAAVLSNQIDDNKKDPGGGIDYVR
jgi:hypothetical protein